MVTLFNCYCNIGKSTEVDTIDSILHPFRLLVGLGIPLGKGLVLGFSLCFCSFLWVTIVNLVVRIFGDLDWYVILVWLEVLVLLL